MRKGCWFAAFVLVVAACLVLYRTRSHQIERGLKLVSYVAGDFTYDVWSYGDWVNSRQSGVHVSTFAPPYTLVVAIQPSNREVESIEILAAVIIDDSGNRTPVLDQIDTSIGGVKARSAAVINAPYAVFTFESLLESDDSITLEIEFRAHTSDASLTTRQLLEVQGFENKTRSFTFWDVMSSA